MIYFLTGKPGTGKTLTSVALGRKFIKQGRDVFFNFDVDYTPLDVAEKVNPLRFAWTWFKETFDFQKPRSQWGKVYRWGRTKEQGLKEFPKINRGVIFMDEGHIWVNSRMFMELPLEFHYKVAQHRKDGLDIYIISQAEGRIDKVIRELVNDVINLHKFPDGPRVTLFHWWNCYDIGEIDKEVRKSHGFKLWFPDRVLYKCYNTFFKFEDTGELQFEVMYDPEKLLTATLKGGEQNESNLN
jgi:hypothetical protein